MKVSVITTIAQHSRGADLHFENLRWALQGMDYTIYVQTFAEYGIRSADDLVVIAADANPRQFYWFWDHIDQLLLELCPKTDVFLFMEQDVFFCVPASTQCSSESIVINMESDYLAIFDASKKRLYPRLWEGGLWVPSKIINRALSDGITFGSHLKGGFENSSSFYTTTKNTSLEFRTVKHYVDKAPYFDTLFEFSYYCFRNGDPWISRTGQHFDYECGEDVVHFGGIDMMLHDGPEIYERLDAMGELLESYPLFDRRFSSGCLLLLLSGVHGPSPLMASYLRHRSGLKALKAKIQMMLPSMKQWATREQLERLLWADKMTSYRF